MFRIVVIVATGAAVVTAVALLISPLAGAIVALALLGYWAFTALGPHG